MRTNMSMIEHSSSQDGTRINWTYKSSSRALYWIKFEASIMSFKKIKFHPIPIGQSSLLLIVLLVFQGMSVFAQKADEYVSIQSGEKIKSSDGNITDIIGYDESGLYVLKSKRKKHTLVRYNQALEEVISKELEEEFEGEKHSAEYLFYFSGKLWLFSSYRDREEDELQLYQSFIDAKTLQGQAKKKLIANVKRTGRIFKSEGHFDLRFSKDKERIAIVTHYPYQKNEFEKLKVNLFSSETGEVQWEKEIQIPYREDLFDIEGVKIDAKGNFYVLGKRYGDGLDGKLKEKVDGEKNYDYVVLGYFNDGKESREYLLQLEDKFISDLQLAVNENGELICAGFYTNTDRSGLSGSYFMRLNPTTKEVLAQSLKGFNIDFVTQNFTQKEKKKAEKRDAKGKEVGLTRYELDEMVLRYDGGVMLVGEQYFVQVVTHQSPGANGAMNTTTTTHYYHNDIIVVNINAEGQIEWTDKIPKRQHTTNDGGMFNSYLLGAKGDKIYMIFNDHPKNLNLTVIPGISKFATFSKQKNSIVTLVSLDVEGRNKRMSLLSLKDEGMLSRPMVSEQVDQHTLVLLAQRGRNEKLFILRMKE